MAGDRRLFEKLCLEGFQSGLSWLTILKKRESFRAAFLVLAGVALAGALLSGLRGDGKADACAPESVAQ